MTTPWRLPLERTKKDPAAVDTRKTIHHMRTATLNLSLITLSLIVVSCGTDPEESPQYQQLSEDNSRIEAAIAEKDSTINALFSTVNRISDNLRTIRTKQGQLTEYGEGVEKDKDMEERIMSDIESIDGLLAENRALLDRLRSQARSSAANISELQRTLTELESSLTEKDAEIETIKEELSSTNSSLATLIEMYRDKAQQVAHQTEAMNAAWYAVGTSKELRDNGVLSKEGGVIGVGSVDKLNTVDLPTSYFTRIDLSDVLEIPLMSEKARLITAHPAGSYRLEAGSGKLVITNADRFWSISKYLVVVVD